MGRMRKRFLNIALDYVRMGEVLDAIDISCSKGKKLSIVPVNVDVLVKAEKDPKLKRAIDEADFVLADGQILIWISRLNQQPIPEKISGSDLVPEVCKMAAAKGYSIFILGGKEGVAEKAAKNLRRQLPDIRIAGTYCPPFGFEYKNEEISKMNDAVTMCRPDILILCLGCPKQEKYFYTQNGKYEAAVTICAGATVDFLAGNIKRAPAWVSKCGFEWFYRFAKEPKRLFKRYFIDDMYIIKMMWRYRPGRDHH